MPTTKKCYCRYLKTMPRNMQPRWLAALLAAKQPTPSVWLLVRPSAAVLPCLHCAEHIHQRPNNYNHGTLCTSPYNAYVTACPHCAARPTTLVKKLATPALASLANNGCGRRKNAYMPPA